MSRLNSITDFPRNEAGLVGEFIGSAYDTVKRVYDNLDEIRRLDNVLGEIPTLAEEVLNEALPPFLVEVENVVNSSLEETKAAAQSAANSATLAAENASVALEQLGEVKEELEDSYGFKAPVPYAPGVALIHANETFSRDGVQYRIADPEDLPYTLTGTWENESSKFVSLGDSKLRLELASTLAGAEKVARASVSVRSLGELRAIGISAASNFATLVLASGAPSFYYRDTEDSVSVDDGVLVIVGADGSRWKLNHDGRLSVLACGAKGDGSTDDSAPFLKCSQICIANDLVMHIPSVDRFYVVQTGLSLNQKLCIEGDSGDTPNVYFGRQRGGSRVQYNGSGDLFAWDSVAPTEGMTATTVTGSSVRDLVLLGTGSGKHAIRVGSATDIGKNDLVRSNITIKNVYVGWFTRGYGIQLNWCFSNTLQDVVVQNCAVDVSLNYAHGTRLIGGNLEQSLMALDCRTSYAVDISGTVIQGIHASRGPIFNMAMPADFFCWAAGWDGSGALGVTRTIPAQYAGVAVRNIGSALNLNDVYWEVNDYNVITELDSFTTIRGGILAVDTETRSFVQIGIGGLVVDDVLVQYNAPTAFEGLFQAERAYAAPCHIGEGVYLPTSLPADKVFTGRTEYVGARTQYLANRFGMIRESRNTFDLQQRIAAPNVSGTATLNFGSPFSNKISAVSTGGNVTVGQSLPVQAVKPGARVSLHLICTAATTVTFAAGFRPVAASYNMGANTQAFFDFEYSNGQWVATNSPVVLAL